MKPLKGNRKYSGFIITMMIYSAVVVITLFRVQVEQIEVPAFCFQLAAAYSILCGLFFGSNVLEHFASERKD